MAKSRSDLFRQSAHLDTDVQSPPGIARWRFLFVFTSYKHTAALCLAGVLSIASGLAIPTLSIFLGKIFGTFTNFGAAQIDGHELVRRVSSYIFGLLVLGGLSGLLNAGFFASWVTFGELQAKHARNQTFQILMYRDKNWFDSSKLDIGAMSSRLHTLIRELQIATSQVLGFLLQYSITMLGALILAFYSSWRVASVTLASVPVSAVIMAAISNRVRGHTAAHAAELDRASNSASHTIKSIDTVKCLNGEEVELKAYMTAIGNAAHFYISQAKLNALQMGLARFVVSSMFVQGCWYGTYLVNHRLGNSGDVLTAFWASLMATQTIEQILPQLLVLEKGRTAGTALASQFALPHAECKISGDSDAVVPKSCQGNIEVEDVYFTYPHRRDQPAVRGLNLTFSAGKTTFVIGRSGSGKSTLASLLVQFYKPDAGDIRIDGVPAQTININWIRNNVTLLQQKSVLFDETIFMNIACGRQDSENVNLQDVKTSLEATCLTDTVMSLPHGLDTIVGPGGNMLSGGQKQRVALARAWLRNTPILILDEATSALDCHTKSKVFAAIREWRRGKTTIIITHDISQIRHDDYVYALDGGLLVQEGFHRDLEEYITELVPHMTEDNTVNTMVERPNERGSSIPNLPGADHNRPLLWDERDSNRSDASSDRQILFSDRTRPVKRKYSTRQRSFVDAKAATVYSSDLFEMEENRARDRNDTLYPRGSSLFASEAEKTWSNLSADDVFKSISHMTRFSRPLSKASTLVNDREHEGYRFEGRRKSTDTASLPEILATIWPALSIQKRGMLTAGIICSLIHAVATPLFSWLFSKLLSTYIEVLDTENSHDARKWSGLILGVAAIDAVASFAMHLLLETCGNSWVNRLRRQAYTNVLRHPAGFLHEAGYTSASLVETLDRNAEEMRNLLGRFAGLIFVAAALMTIAITWSMVISWQLTLVALSSVPLIYALTRAFEHVSGHWETKSNTSASRANGVFNEAFTNIDTVRAMTLEGFFDRRHTRAIQRVLQIGARRAGYSGLFYGLSTSGMIFVTALVFFYGTHLISTGTTQTKDILTVYTLLLFAIANVNGIMSYIPQVASSRSTATQLLRIANLPDRMPHEGSGSLQLKNIDTVKIDEVCFVYASRPQAPVLRSLSLSIPVNSSLALVGATGCGKSTIASLLMNLITPDSGHVFINGQPLRTFDAKSLRNLIALVPQRPILFPASIAANICYPNAMHAEFDIQKIQDAAQSAAIHEFISSLPNGYETVIGSGGSDLSGGQAQRIALARAVYRRPRLLILDEVTSGLDQETAEQVRRLVKALSRKGVGVLVITHDELMMRACEEVAVLRRGRVVERGPFERLAGNKGGELARLLGRE